MSSDKHELNDNLYKCSVQHNENMVLTVLLN